MLQKTSLLSYRTVDLSKKQDEVYKALEGLGTVCNQQIADYLGWPINSVTPRVLELRKKDLVFCARTDIYLNGRRVMFWRIKNRPDID